MRPLPDSEKQSYDLCACIFLPSKTTSCLFETGLKRIYKIQRIRLGFCNSVLVCPFVIRDQMTTSFVRIFKPAKMVSYHKIHIRLIHLKWSDRIKHCPVSWGCRIHWLNLCRWVRPPPQRVSWYDTKRSDGEVPSVLELWGMRSTPSLPLLPGPLWPGVLAPGRALSMG